MAATRDPREENIRALEQLRGGPADTPAPRHAPPPSAPARPADEPLFPELPKPGNATAKPLPPLPPRPAPGRAVHPPQRETQPSYHCLECGYGLFAETGYRCSECGKSYDPGYLAAWFEGTEEERFNHLTFLVNFTLVIKVWAFVAVAMLPIGVQQACMNSLVLVVGSAAAIAACVLAGRDRMDSIAAYYSIAGSIAGGIAGVGILFGGLSDRSTFIWPAMVFAMDALCAAMMLMTLLHPTRGIELWRARSLRKSVLPVAIILPPAVLVLYTLEARFRESLTSAGGSLPAILLAVNTTTLAAAASAVMWVVARQWLVSFRRMVFAAGSDDDNEGESR